MVTKEEIDFQINRAKMAYMGRITYYDPRVAHSPEEKRECRQIGKEYKSKVREILRQAEKHKIKVDKSSL